MIDVTNSNLSIFSILQALNVNIIPITEHLNNQLNQEIIIVHQKNHLLQLIQEYAVDMLVAPASYQSIAIQTQIPFLNNQNHHNYTGYTGIIEAVRQLYTAFKSPIWKRLNSTAPWE
jgi:nitrogenase molybdenum-cofactor synthesis protein NifE